MKKGRIQILILATACFAAFVLGFFAGRNLNRTPVQIQAIQAAPKAEFPAESVPETASEPTVPTEPGIVNINTATAEQLQTLPGIGEVISLRIIDYREENGPFESVGELINVEGIGEKKLEDIWDLVTVGG